MEEVMCRMLKRVWTGHGKGCGQDVVKSVDRIWTEYGHRPLLLMPRYVTSGIADENCLERNYRIDSNCSRNTVGDKKMGLCGPLR
jgi:hypothetical protein